MAEPDIIKQIGQLFMVGIKGDSLSVNEEEFLGSNDIGFVILFSRNFSSPENLRKLTYKIHGLGTIPPLIFIDQEGGPILRLGEKGSTVISHMGIAATGKKNNARLAGKIIGEEMKYLGIDGVFAPVLDVNSKADNPVIGIRSFSDNPSVVSRYASEFYKGLQQSNILGCGKHFPGHGHTATDSHLEIPESDIDRKFLLATNLPPFKKLINLGIDSLMTAHVKFPVLSEEISTFSPEITYDLLRDELNFDGVLFSDCMEMSSVKDNYSSEEIIECSFNSSLDVISISHSLSFQKELLNLTKIKIDSGEISYNRIEKSLCRINNLKKNIGKKFYNKNINSRPLRKKIKSERKIANGSITLLKDNIDTLPIPNSSNILILDIKKIGHTANIGQNSKINLTNGIAIDYFKNSNYISWQYKSPITEKMKKQILKCDHLLIIDHSWSSKTENLKKLFFKNIFNIRRNAILICANSPYVADIFKYFETIILTYGFRKVQIEALFRVLSGKSKPQGKLPVTISSTFPFNSGL